MIHRRWKWLAFAALAPFALVLLVVLGLALFGWNWARAPLQDYALRQTGRELRIGGDLQLVLAWPTPRVRAHAVSFANPPWAATPQMLEAEVVEADLDLGPLWRGQLAFVQVRLTRPRVFLEQASGGRKTWLLDRTQTDEAMRIPIGRLQLDQGEATYIDAPQRTSVRVELSTVEAAPPTAGASAPATRGDGVRSTDRADGVRSTAGAESVQFTARGLFRGLPLMAEGRGGGVLAWRDATLPYPLRVDAMIGGTRVLAEGHVTSLLELRAVDLQLALAGDSLASLFPLIGIALPPTPTYRSAGRLVREGMLWRYEKFSGRIGQSDIAGTLQVDTGGARPLLSGALDSRRLDLADLGPAVGARTAVVGAASGAASAAAGVPVRASAKTGAAAPGTRVLPDLPLDTSRWPSLDADVTLRAQALLRAKTLPLDTLQVRVRLKDASLRLDPLSFGVAGGKLQAQVTLDGRAQPLRGQAKAQLRGLQLGQLLPQADLRKTSFGRLDGAFDLAGQGASVGRMLASADGRLSLVAQDGEISRLLMEQVGLHLLEILQLQLSGDQSVKLHCAVADFDVVRGRMQVRAMVLDTAVNTLVGDGVIDLAQESFELRVVSRTKVSSLVALRSPIHVRGSLGAPRVEVDRGRVVARGVGALALGLLNPLLALVPLFEAGPGEDGSCARLVGEARAPGPRNPR